MERCFVAIWPDASTTEALLELPRPPADGVRWSPVENWHVTLRFLGDVDVAAVVDSIAAAELPGADVVLGPAVTRLDERQVVLPATGADELSRLIDEATATIGVARRRPFVGHLTLARLRPPATTEVIGHRFDARFPVGEIVVATSELLPTGAHYHRAASLPLPMG